MDEAKMKEPPEQKTTITGIARDAKGGAVLIIENGEPVYIIGMASWQDDILGKEIKMEGIMKEEKLIPDPVIDEDGAISQGAIGMQRTLHEGKILEQFD